MPKLIKPLDLNFYYNALEIIANGNKDDIINYIINEYNINRNDHMLWKRIKNKLLERCEMDNIDKDILK